MLSPSAHRILLLLVSVIVAPFVVVSLVSIGAQIYSLIVRPVSLSFRFFLDSRATSFLSLPRPLTAYAILICSALLLFMLVRFRA